ncbi:MAG: hypothetical protein U0694_06765 [Anaerolineae bacterium]
MGLTALYEALGAAEGSAVELMDMWVGAWGRDVVMEGECGGIRFKLAFDECREMQWRVYAHENDDQPTALVDFAAGRGQHRSPAKLLTDTFGLTLWYGAMMIQRLE